MGRTIAEKIFSAKAGREVKAGELVVVEPDFVMGHDTRSPLAIEILERAGLPVNIDRQRAALVIDHRVPCASELFANRHLTMRRFARQHGIRLYDAGSGICHLLIPEQGHLLPGDLVAASDSHSTTYGAMNALGIGIGISELAALLSTGQLWFKVPKSMRVELAGRLQPGVYSKDVILQLIGMVGEAGASYLALEFTGEAISHMSMDARFTISNMATDLGAKAALMEADEVTREWLQPRARGPWQPVSPDPDASYARQLRLDVSTLAPKVAVPHRVDHVVSVGEVQGIPIQQACVGTCTNGRLEDIRITAAILKGKSVAPGVRLFVVPGTREVYRQAMREGLLEDLFEAGAIILQANCATCSMNQRQAIPGDGEVVISSANRNFQGRLENKNALIYLGSPATVAASALEGVIADPRQHL